MKNKSELQGIQLTYEYNDKEYVGYLSLPDDPVAPKPGIMLCPEFWGMTDYIKWRADEYAALGYAALVVDFYGDGMVAKNAEQATNLSGNVKDKPQHAVGVFQAAMDAFHRESIVDAANTAAVGYCFGGALALSMANAGLPLKAVMAFHSQVELPIMPNEKCTAKIVVANGDEDPFVSKESIETWTNAMDAIDVSYEYVTYPGVKHAYTNKNANAKAEKYDLPLDYDAEADKDSWNRVQDLLAEVFSKN
ncbi:Dienelactone hydrolase [Nonlabens sp. Hel1_33_55]|uniref:dienelactone hydrolase family protein n=1 Tax=Nonlabens sp. Hel1_33_55 TaxID=1336802 RepID=UPI000875B6A7|nr:dienelactone hydrolase family protein [Nonlabens sp. Hel1_33_55]SCY28971.1 Dienelactone hydrolase [Nonlabens sp. Hel1_33_55]